MLAYRHAFHAGNHADVLKHLVLVTVLRHLNQKEKGWRLLDTHAGAGGYALSSPYAEKHREHAEGIGRLWNVPAAELPPPLADYVALVRSFNSGNTLAQYPGSPGFAHLLMRPQDQLRLYELHPTDHRILDSYLGQTPGVEVHSGDGFAGLKAQLPPPTRRGAVLFDPPYEIKTDYARVLAAWREGLERFAEGVQMAWIPQVQRVEASQLPQRLKASATRDAKKGWLHARLTVGGAQPDGFGMTGSHMVVANPPHTLAPALRACLPVLVERLGRDDRASWSVESAES